MIKSLADRLDMTIVVDLDVKEQNKNSTSNTIINLQASESGTVGRPIQVDVSFLNPLPVTLTNCELKVEGPGLQETVTYKQPYVFLAIKLSHVTKKSVFRVCDQVRLKPACSATETS